MDQVHEIQKGDSESYKALIASLKLTEFDLLLCPHESVRSALLVRQLKARRKISFHKWWNGVVFGERIRKDLTLPESLRQLSLLQESDPVLKKQIQDFRRQDLEWKKKKDLHLTPVPAWASPKVEITENFNALSERLGLANRYVCLFPGSVWKTKQWTEEGFIGVGQGLQAQGFQVLVMGGPGEEDLAARVSSHIPQAVNLAAKTSLTESLLILSKAQMVVTNDSAGQHLAALVEAPTVSVFGPTVLDFGYRPWNSKASVVERQGLACRPCGKHGHHKCPIGTHECMKRIQAKEVLERIQELLPSRG